MTHSPSNSLWLASALIVYAGSGHAQAPPDVVLSDASGNTAMGSGAMFSNTLGAYNTAAGSYALYSNGEGNLNTAFGRAALYANTTGQANAAAGTGALQNNTSGSYNTADGEAALAFNTTGSRNSASGYEALLQNTTGSFNTASGSAALYSNTIGDYNTATGYEALYYNQGGDNAAFGFEALYSNTNGSANTAAGYKVLYSSTTGIGNASVGAFALYANTTGNYNSAYGDEALLHNTIGASNTASGRNALFSNTTGSNNIAIGDSAGYRLTIGSGNIDIANQGLAGENGTIRIGAPSTQVATYIAGIDSAHVTGSAVYVTANGQLGVLASSERYKTGIAPIGEISEKLQELHPVAFHLKTEPQGAIQYGLIAEQVDEVYPELVIRDHTGKIQGVRYDELAPMLLNELQKLQHKTKSQAKQLDEQGAELRKMRKQLAEVMDSNRTTQAALLKLRIPNGRMAMR
jgi:trimeric autotransporter adhesin